MSAGAPEPRSPKFALRSRILHWVMAAMVLAMLFIGVRMVASLGDYHRLVSIHRPLGIAIFVLTIVRLVNRRLTPLPDFLGTMSARERWIASWSERLLYTLLLVMPLVGWAMLSAGHYPILLFRDVHLPAVVPASPMLHALLRRAHTVLAYVLFATFLAHLTAVLFHTIVLRDGLLRRMVGGRRSGKR